MLIIVLIIPIFLSSLGSKIFKIYRTRRDELESKLRYGTALANKSDFSFAFAQHYFGSLWEYGGVAFAFVSGIIMLLTMGKSFINVGATAGVLILMQLAFIVMSFIFTESALRTRFDGEGNPFDEKDRLIEPPLPDVPEEDEAPDEAAAEAAPADGENPQTEGEAAEPGEENPGEAAPEGETPENEAAEQEGGGAYSEEDLPQQEYEPAEAEENVPV